jgi:hypothetical protein
MFGDFTVLYAVHGFLPGVPRPAQAPACVATSYPSCRICNSAVMNISICNAPLHLTGYVKNICRFFRIANAYTLHCRIANSAGRG